MSNQKNFSKSKYRISIRGSFIEHLLRCKWKKNSEAALQSCSLEKVSRKYGENLQENIHFHFNKVALQLYWNHTSAWLFSCKVVDIFRTTFPKNTYKGLLLETEFFLLFSFNVIVKLLDHNGIIDFV